MSIQKRKLDVLSSPFALTNYDSFSFLGLFVYMNYQGGFAVAVKNWCPKRFSDGKMYHQIWCTSFDDMCFTFKSLVKECFEYVESSI